MEIYEVCVGLNVADLRGFEIRTSTGYLATFPEAHTECDRPVCVKQSGHSTVQHDCSYCHGLYHIEQVRALALAVAATYGSADKGKSNPGAGRPHIAAHKGGYAGKAVPQLSVRDWEETEWAQTMEKPLP